MAVDRAGRVGVRARSSIAFWLALSVVAGGRGGRAGAGSRPGQVGRRVRRGPPGRCPRGNAGDDDARDRRGHQERAGLAGAHPECRRFVRQRDLSRQHRRDQPGRAGVHVVGLEPGPRSVRAADRQGPGLRDGQHVALGLHRGRRRLDARADVFARVRHAVPGRSLRHDASARDPREASEGRPPDHRHARTSRGDGGISRCGATPISR